MITDVLGYIGALVIGVILGLIGGGGSILTLPVLVYLLQINPITATAYSLFIVGTSSLVGTLQNIKKGLVDFNTAFVFSIPAFVAVFLSRKYVVPAIPNEIVLFSYFNLSKHTAIMLLFAIIMLLSSFAMIGGKEENEKLRTPNIKYRIPIIVLEGLLVGFVTGLIGAGGGFLIIPALVMLAKLPMKKAIGTSLLIISIKSLIGFLGDIGNLEIEWNFLLLFTFFAVLGIFIGGYLNNFMKGEKLKKAFGWFILVMGIYILVKEFSRS